MRRWLFAWGGLMIASPLGAQTSNDGSLRDQFRRLFSFGGAQCLSDILCLSDANGASVANAFTDALTETNELVINFVAGAIGRSIGSIPVPATSSGSIPEFVDGRLVARSLSAGPVYAERAPSLGRNRLLFGVNFTNLAYESLRGVNIDELVFNFQHVNLPGSGALGDPEVENNILRVSTHLSVNLFASSFFVTYGLTDWMDVGVAVPVVRTSVAGWSEGQIVPFGTGSVYSFGDRPTDDPQIRSTSPVVDASATGIGDVAARVKINVRQTRRWGVGILGDVRLPTGDEDDFLGLGETSIRGLGIVSGEFGTFGPHANFGYLYTSGGSRLQNHSLLANFGFDQLVTPGVTFVADVISAWELDRGERIVPEPIEITEPFPRTVPASPLPDRRDNRVDASLGFKFTRGASTGRGFTFLLNSQIPLNRGGLRADVVWSAGLEYKF